MPELGDETAAAAGPTDRADSAFALAAGLFGASSSPARGGSDPVAVQRAIPKPAGTTTTATHGKMYQCIITMAAVGGVSRAARELPEEASMPKPVVRRGRNRIKGRISIMERASGEDPTQPVQVVAAALVDNLERPTVILAGHRRYRPIGWELPGGKIEPGESLAAALHRELAEELGVTARLGAELPGPLPDGMWRLSERHVMRVWFAQVDDGQPVPLEAHDELRWLRRDELYDVDWLPADYPIVAALAQRLFPPG